MPKELTIPKSKNAESFYISKSFINDKGAVPPLLYASRVLCPID